MEIKKDPKYDLERMKSLFFQFGLIFALAFVLVAFEWEKAEKGDNFMNQLQVVDIPEEMVEITRQEEPTPPPPEKTTTELEIVEDDVEVEDELDINIEDDMNSKVDEFIPPVDEDVEPEIVEAEIFQIVEEMPSFPGGEEALFEYLKNNIKYPQMARESNIQGTVYIGFVVEPDGSISHVEVKRGIGGGCDVEAVRVVKNMPRWTPGKQRGKPVRVSYTLPIKFILEG